MCAAVRLERMSPLRPFRRDDLPQVAALYETRLSGGRAARPGMVEHFAHQFLDAPTVDPEIPSLVATDGGDRVAGFLGASVVPMLLDGRPVRAVATGPLFTEPDQRLVAVLLLRGLLAGPQALTFSAKHNLDAHPLFARLGARAVHPRCVWWESTLRPDEHHWVAASASVQGDALAAEPLTPALAASSLPELAGWARLRPVYEAPFLDWRFAQLELARRLGVLRAEALRDEGGGVVGWFVALIPEAGVATAVQVIAREGSEASVLRRLIDAAHEGGALSVRGRLEPELAFALRGLPCVLSQRACLLVHADDEAVWWALTADRAILTLLDGEPWLAEMHEGRRA